MNTANKFNEYAHLNNFSKANYESSVSWDGDEQLDVLYSTDAITGYPTSDLHVFVDKSAARELVTRVELSPEVPVGVRTNDVDLALRTIPNKGEDIVSFSNRIRAMLTEDMNVPNHNNND